MQTQDVSEHMTDQLLPGPEYEEVSLEESNVIAEHPQDLRDRQAEQGDPDASQFAGPEVRSPNFLEMQGRGAKGMVHVCGP